MGSRWTPLRCLVVAAMAALVVSGCGEGADRGGEAGTADADTRAAGGVPLGPLPDTVHPVRYRLALRIDPESARFSGHVEIDVRLDKAADGIWLHGKDLDVGSVTVRGEGQADQPARYRQMADTGVARVDFGRTLAPGPITVSFDYRAPFNDSLEGLYRVTDGGKRYATTQFEATSARLAFPCFDEPRFKTPFDVTLTVRKGVVAVTNTPEAAEEPAEDGFVRVRFAPTAPLPTYLIAFIVGPWDERAGDAIPATDLRDRPVPLHGFAAAGKGDQLSYALGRTGAIVGGLEDYFGIAYPFRKLDLIAVPDFAAGAMENAATITYREQLLLFGSDASIVRKQSFVSAHAHELAHQWFGDLVTPKWWDDIWLNEAFATWMAAKVLARLEPDQGYDTRRLRRSLEVMDLDALASARRIRQPIESAADIGSAFDDITYDKGAAVLSMLERFVGADRFQQGVHDYLHAHEHGSGDTADFVQAIAATRPDLPAGQVNDAFSSFLDQPGTPLVNVDWTCPASGSARVSVKQSRYLPLGSSADGDRQWVLPLCVAFGHGGKREEHCEVVRGREAEFDLGAPCPDYVMPNADAAGYYRFGLSMPHWKALLATPDLTDQERLAAAASLSGAFHAGRIDVGEYLALVPTIRPVRARASGGKPLKTANAGMDSDSVDVITAPLADMKWIHDRLLRGESQHRLREILGDYFSDVAVLVPPDARPTSRSQVQLQSAMARLYALLIESPSWRGALARQAAAYLNVWDSGKGIPPASTLPANLRETAFTVAVEERGPAFAERLLALFKSSNDAQLRQDILRALSRGGDAATLERLREMALTDSVRDNEVSDILRVQMQEANSRDAAWQWLLAHFDAVVARLPYWVRGELVHVGSSFCSSERAEEIRSRLADKVSSLGSGPRSLAETLERIRLCQSLVEAQEDAANRLFAKDDGR